MLTRFPFVVVSPACLKAAEVAVMTMTMTTLKMILDLVLQNADLALCSEETLVLELKALALDCFPTATFTSPQNSHANATLAARSSETAALTTNLNQSLRASVREKIALASMSQHGHASATANVHSTETAAPTLGLAIALLDFARPKTIL